MPAAPVQDGKTLYSGSRDNTVRVWALPSGECVDVLKGHSETVTSVAVAPDGKTIYSASGDNTIRAWAMPGRALQVDPRLTPG